MVSGPENLIKRYNDRAVINKSYLLCIEDIHTIEPESKIGESIKKRWEKEDEFNIKINFMNQLKEEEFHKLFDVH